MGWFQSILMELQTVEMTLLIYLFTCSDLEIHIKINLIRTKKLGDSAHSLQQNMVLLQIQIRKL